MRKLLSVLLALLLAVSLLLTACAPPENVTITQPDGTENDIQLTVVSDAPTDETPEDVHANSPPEETAEPLTEETAQPQPEETAAPETEPVTQAAPTTKAQPAIDEDGWYYSKDDVALYIHTYGRLPGNFITKKAAQKLGWSSGSLDRYAPGKAIGGDRFGNYEGLLPAKKGRTYTECDIDTKGAKKRGAKRIVFSNDGLIYYSDDHYESFTLLYGEE